MPGVSAGKLKEIILPSGQTMVPVGKKKAGRLLEGEKGGKYDELAWMKGK